MKKPKPARSKKIDMAVPERATGMTPGGRTAKPTKAPVPRQDDAKIAMAKLQNELRTNGSVNRGGN